MNGVAVNKATAEQRVVAVRHDAGVGMRGEILLQPRFLRRANAAAAYTSPFAIGIQNDDVPHAKFVAVVTPAGGPGQIAPILKIARGRTRRVVFMIARSGTGASFEAAPCGLVTIPKVRDAAGFVGKVAGGENGAGNLFQELGGGTSAFRVLATGDVTGANQDELLGWSWSWHGRLRLLCASKGVKKTGKP